VIRNRGGRSHHIRTKEEEAALIEDSIASLKPEQRRLFLRMIQEAAIGSNSTYQAISRAVFDREPVDIRTFVQDPYFLGKSCESLYEPLKDELDRIFEADRYIDIILTGSTGWGKTFLGSIIFCRQLYELSCMRSPQSALGIAPTSNIYLFCMSKSLHLAKSVVLGKVMEKISSSPYFKKEFPWTERADGIRFPKSIIVEIGSVNSERALGLDVVGFLMDETNFMGRRKKPVIQSPGQTMTAANFDLAERVYVTLTNRIKSRFLSGGKVPMKTVLMSSKTTSNSFSARRVNERKNDPTTYVVDKATWDVKPAESFSGKYFRVLVGQGSTRSRILAPKEEVHPSALRDGSTIINVPFEYVKEFQINLVSSIQDVAGMATDAVASFLTIQACLYRPTIRPELKHPFSSETWILQSKLLPLWDVLCERKKIKVGMGHHEYRWVPRRHPDSVRVIHVDQSLARDGLGISMGHTTRLVQVERRSPDFAETYFESAPEIEIDFVLRVKPPSGEYILLQEIRALIYALRDHGFEIALTTLDKYQSADGIQILRDNGIPANLLSVDDGTEAYEALRNALMEGRVRMYEYEPFLTEMKQLEYDPLSRKVDHPLGGSKDTSDAVAGVVTNLELMALRQASYIDSDLVHGGADLEDTHWVTQDSINPRAPFRHQNVELRHLRGAAPEPDPILTQKAIEAAREYPNGTTEEDGLEWVSPSKTPENWREWDGGGMTELDRREYAPVERLNDAGLETKKGTSDANPDVPAPPFIMG
jgi:hypothetical protein